MAEYLNRIGAGLILLDAAPLSYDWIPPNVVGRQDEQEQLYKISGLEADAAKEMLLDPLERTLKQDNRAQLLKH